MGSSELSSTQSRGSPKGSQEKPLEGNGAREGCTSSTQEFPFYLTEAGSDKNTQPINSLYSTWKATGYKPDFSSLI